MFSQQTALLVMFVTVLVFAVVIGFGAWALTRKRQVARIAFAHPYRRRRTVLVAVDRRKQS